MFEAIKFIMEKMEKAINSIEHFQHDEVSGAPMMQEINNQIPDQPRSFRSGTNSNYTGMTRLELKMLLETDGITEYNEKFELI
uniref:Uncharacterized protein n=1 Tax=Brassica oleracea var. oleracea TaxID=109376 RepID=A0A0D3E9Z6_BRAOL